MKVDQNLSFVEIEKNVNLIDLVRGFSKTHYSRLRTYLIAKIGVDTAENEPLKVHLVYADLCK